MQDYSKLNEAFSDARNAELDAYEALNAVVGIQYQFITFIIANKDLLPPEMGEYISAWSDEAGPVLAASQDANNKALQANARLGILPTKRP